MALSRYPFKSTHLGWLNNNSTSLFVNTCGNFFSTLTRSNVSAGLAEIILMEDPTSALDPISTLKVEELVQELKQNYSIIIVTHNMQQAARISDKTAFFLNGEVIEFDATNTIFSNPSDKRTEDNITGRFG